MNCSYCQSKIFEKDRVCSRCGAPNTQDNKMINTFGGLMIVLESYPIVEGVPGNPLMFTYNHTPKVKSEFNL